ncbi:MAG TPA: DUF1801 domain-containing protein [Candidatus Eisenbacteria bacterium]|nr:DUF1801 domain-containing protein [Candidatus Eisenbacteria bacterium]
MAELKTKKTAASVAAFLKKVPDEETRADCFALVKLMKSVTRSDPKMWGASMVGFGEYHYVYASGQEGDWPLTGFSPRKQNLTIYIMAGFDRYPALMKKLGTFKTGKSCLYVKRLSDVDPKVLRELVAESVTFVKKHQKGC